MALAVYTSDEATTTVDGDDFAAALVDEQTQKLAFDGVDYLRQLQEQGRDHTVPFLNGD